MNPEFIVLGLILSGALYFFWTQKMRTDITALVVMLALATGCSMSLLRRPSFSSSCR